MTTEVKLLLVVFIVLFVAVISLTIVLERMSKRVINKIREYLILEGWYEVPVSAAIVPPFLKDYSSNVHLEMYRHNDEKIQIIDHYLTSKIHIATISFSYKIPSLSDSYHVLLLANKSTVARNTSDLVKSNVASFPAVADKYTAYVGVSTPKSVLLNVCAFLEPICNEMPYTCIEMNDGIVYITICTHGIIPVQVSAIANHGSDLIAKLSVDSQ